MPDGCLSAAYFQTTLMAPFECVKVKKLNGDTLCSKHVILPTRIIKRQCGYCTQWQVDNKIISVYVIVATFEKITSEETLEQ